MVLDRLGGGTGATPAQRSRSQQAVLSVAAEPSSALATVRAFPAAQW